MAATKGNDRVPLGRTLATPGVLNVTTQTERNIAFNRHARGDWGDVVGEDWRSNDQALQTGKRLLSVYHALNGTTFWIITEEGGTANLAGGRQRLSSGRGTGSRAAS